MTTGDRRASPARLAVFLSGSGRTLVNLAETIGRGELPATIALVVASRPCTGLDRARALGLDSILIEGDPDPATLERLLGEHRIDWIVLAGYLRLLPIPERWAHRAVNIHPALLPDFGGPGMFGGRVHRAVLGSGARESGCTVHRCDRGYDTGPIVLQLRCPVLEGDTPESLAARVFELELRAYPEALRRLIAGSADDSPDADRGPGRPGPAGPTIEGRPRRP